MAPAAYVVVTGGVLSGLGKGITTSSMGTLLKARGLRVTVVKIDPYVNCDAGTMNPFEHGEVFVLEDGGEVDLDLGNYERFLDINATRDNNLTTGKVFRNVIEKERQGRYLGKTVQIVPHVTNEIREGIKMVAEKSNADVCLIEVGGTVGDMESMPFLEAMRQLHRLEGHERVVFVHTTLVPVLDVVGEPKTKPTQHSVRDLKAAGIEPDMIVCRSPQPIDQKTREKIALFCDVDPKAVVSAHDVRSKYHVPVLLASQGVDEWLVQRLRLKSGPRDITGWSEFVRRLDEPERAVTIAVVGKYTNLSDAYMSIREAFVHAGARFNARVDVRWIESDRLEQGDLSPLDGADGLLVPGGFGSRGTEGKIAAIRWARENKVPFLGICFGFQLACVEFARHVLNLPDAHHAELVDELGVRSSHLVIDLLPEQRGVDAKGGTMRLGATPVRITPGTTAHRLYGAELVLERHRHRYEVNPGYISKFEAAGLRFSGRDPTGLRMEVLELKDHPYFMGGQFHPEFKSRPSSPAPLFSGLVQAVLERSPK